MGVRKIVWVLAFAATATACVSPAPARRQRTVVEVVGAHDEPELVSGAQRAPGRAASASSSKSKSKWNSNSNSRSNSKSTAGSSDGRSRSPDAARAVGLRHRVQPGETFYRIALNHGVPVEALMAENGVTDPRSLEVGQELRIPAKVAASASSSARTSGSDASSRARSAQGAKSTAPVRRAPREAVAMPTGKGVLSWPLRGVLYARFGKKGREQHDGIDLAAPSGTPIKTAGEGKVLYAGEQKGYGLIVIIDHGDDLITLYAHNRDLRVKTGQRVRNGQVVATVGESGRTSGPHLHFEVRKKGIAVDPLKYLGAPPDRAMGRRARDAH